MPFDWSSLFAPKAASTSGGLLGQNDPYKYIGDLGFGLLAAGGPSFQPTSFGSALGKAGAYANERQDQGITNDMRRQAIIDAQKNAGLDAELQAAVASGDEAAIKAATLKRYPEIYAKSLFTTQDPETMVKIADIQERLLGRAETLKKTKIENVGNQVANEAMMTGAADATGALDYLDKTLGRETADKLVSSNLTPVLRQAQSFGVTGVAPEWLTGVPKDKWPTVIDKLEAINKARSAVSIGATNSQLGVQGMVTAGKSFGEGAGVEVNKRQFGEVLRRSKRVADLNEWDLPPGVTVQEAEDAGVNVKGAGKPPSEITPPAARGAPQFTPQGGVTYSDPSQSKYTDLPPPPGAAPPAAPTAPPVRKVSTQAIDPATGNPMRSFPRKADAIRSAKPGEKVIYQDTDGVMRVWQN